MQLSQLIPAISFTHSHLSQENFKQEMWAAEDLIKMIHGSRLKEEQISN